MKKKIVIEILLKDKMRRNTKVKPFDQTLKSLGVISSQQQLVTK